MINSSPTSPPTYQVFKIGSCNVYGIIPGLAGEMYHHRVEKTTALLLPGCIFQSANSLVGRAGIECHGRSGRIALAGMLTNNSGSVPLNSQPTLVHIALIRNSVSKSFRNAYPLSL